MDAYSTKRQWQDAHRSHQTLTELPDVPLAPIPLEPRAGIPDVVETPRHLTRALEALAAGLGPIGVDAERASGYRYGQRAYLIQLYRENGGTWLIDPIALPDLSRLAAFLRPVEWILHAASQDLPCLAEVGIVPTRLFDTELAGRLLNRDRVSLGHLVASELGEHLEKGHGAADWSTRPLPDSWRRYAALDVEVLPALRVALLADLQAQDKQRWAEQEFAALLNSPAPVPRIDPWRRNSGLHKVRTRRGLAIVRHLWEVREEIAKTRDISPGRILPDASITTLALTPPKTKTSLAERPEVARGNPARYRREWWAAITAAQQLDEALLPPLTLVTDDPPPARSWSGRNPDAAQRLQAAKSVLNVVATEQDVPLENLLSPDTLRRLLWSPPDDLAAHGIDQALADLGARPWQRALVCDVLSELLQSQVGEQTNN